MAIDLGPLDRRAEFLRARTVRNARNEPVPDGWDPIARVMASRYSTSDGERNAGAQVQRVVTDRLVTHYGAALAGVTGADQVEVDGVTFDIVGKKELGRREGLEFSVKARPEAPAP